MTLVAVRSTIDVVDVSGPDAVTYLQGQLSADVAGLPVGATAFSFLLAPQGRVVAWFRLLRRAEDDLALVVADGVGRAVEERLRRFWLRTDAAMTLWERVAVTSVVGTPDEEAAGGDLSVREAAERLVAKGASAEPSGPAPFIVDSGVDGWIDVVGAHVDPASLGLPEGGVDQLNRLRVRHRRPAMGAEIVEGSVPAASGVVAESASFTKGCYVGQELVARMDSRGADAPASLVGLSGTGPVPPVPTRLDALTITTAVADDDGRWIGLGLLARSFAGDRVDMDGVAVSIER